MIKRSETALLAMAVLIAAIFVLVVVATIEITGLQESKRLELVHMIMRHGARTPVSTYPKDPHINDTLYPIGWGQLTNEGKLAMYDIGVFLRERYGHFLGTHYTPDIFYTQSTDTDRTKASLQLVNAGLWPPEPPQKWGPIDWQPIPIHMEPLSEDMLLLVRKPCPQYHIQRAKVMQSEEVQELFQKYDSLFREITELTGQNVTDFDGVQDVFSTLKAEEGFNLTLPEWTKDYYPHRMIEPTAISFVLNAYNDQMNRLKGGVLLKKIISDWRAKSEETMEPEGLKAILYGGHDSTISNLLSTLKVWDLQLPDYGNTILLELSKDLTNNKYGVEVFLRNSTKVPPYKLTIPGCSSFCPLDRLVELTENVIPQDWEAECKTDDVDFVLPELSGP